MANRGFRLPLFSFGPETVRITGGPMLLMMA